MSLASSNSEGRASGDVRPGEGLSLTVTKQQLEICICAAVIGEGGEIIRCQRHADGIRALDARFLRMKKNDPDAQGFITSSGRYVGRKEGRKLQDAAGIPSVDPSGYMLDTLTSEDLY